MAVGRASGENRAVEAAQEAISSRLLDITIDGARGILFNVTGGPDLSLFEVNEAASIVKQTAHPDVNLIFGAVIDDSLTDEIHITVIATGFDAATHDRPAVLHKVAVPTAEPKVGKRTVPVPDFPVRTLDSENLDIPAFLRKHVRGSD